MDNVTKKNAARLSQLDSKILAGFAAGLLEMLYPEQPEKIEGFVNRMVSGKVQRVKSLQSPVEVRLPSRRPRFFRS